MKSNTLVIGPIGSGKSWVLRTLLNEYPDHLGKIRKGAGKSVRMLATEPGWSATNGDLTCEMGFHVKEHLPADIPWDASIQWLDLIGNMGSEQIKKFNVPPSIKGSYNQFIGLFQAAADYSCGRCGENFGMVDGWNEDAVFVNDGLSGITTMAVHFTVGPKPTLTWPDIDSAQHHIESYIKKCVALKCSYVLIAHWAREPREIEGGTVITVDTVGQKLAPRLLKPFDEIIVAQRDVNKYTWSTNDTRIDLKARRLPYSSTIEPDFTQIFRGNER